MKISKLINFLILFVNFATGQIAKQQEFEFSENQKKFIRENLPEMQVYFLKDKNILFAYSEGNLDVFSNDAEYNFDLKMFSESYLKFNILNGKKVVGRVFVKSESMNIESIEIYDRNLKKRLGGESIKLSKEMEIKSL